MMSKGIPLASLCESKIDTLKCGMTDVIDYIDISSIDNQNKTISSYQTVEMSDAPSRAKQLVLQNDILVSTVRPNLNAVAVVDIKTSNLQVASTGYCVLRCKEEVNPRYIFHFCTSKRFVEEMSGQATGASYPAVSNSIVKNCIIVLPDRDEQNKIVSILDKVSNLIISRQQQLRKMDDLVKSRFVEMFGDPVENEKNWPTNQLQLLCNGIGDGLHGTPEYDEFGEYPFINGNNLIDGKIIITAQTKSVNQSEYDRLFIDIENNAILISINGTLGKLAFYNGEKVVLGKSACYCNLRESINKIFVYGAMRSDSFQIFLEKSSTKSTIKNVGLKAMREYPMIVPPLSIQNQFATFVQQVDKLKFEVQKGLEKLELLKRILMRKYYG